MKLPLWPAIGESSSSLFLLQQREGFSSTQISSPRSPLRGWRRLTAAANRQPTSIFDPRLQQPRLTSFLNNFSSHRVLFSIEGNYSLSFANLSLIYILSTLFYIWHQFFAWNLDNGSATSHCSSLTTSFLKSIAEINCLNIYLKFEKWLKNENILYIRLFKFIFLFIKIIIYTYICIFIK